MLSAAILGLKLKFSLHANSLGKRVGTETNPGASKMQKREKKSRRL